MTETKKPTSDMEHDATDFKVMVLLPFAQLLPYASALWPQPQARYETTRTWAESIATFVPSGYDLHFSTGQDSQAAWALLEQAGLSEHAATLAGPLREAAWQLASTARAIAPEQRLAWAEQMRGQLQGLWAGPILALESAVARIALQWAASSAYATDVLFGQTVPQLAVVQGFHIDPLSQALLQRHGDRAQLLPLPASQTTAHVQLHACADFEAEAQRTAAVIGEHIAHGHTPIALIAQDRTLTRRVQALLRTPAVVIKDETGWTLSTTRSAATLMSLLRAASVQASSDAVLAWLKNLPELRLAVEKLEADLRRKPRAVWQDVALEDPTLLAVDQVRLRLQTPRALSAWLNDTQAALQAVGLWDSLQTDEAGAALIEALAWQDGAAAGRERRLSLAEFIAWVDDVLESTTWSPQVQGKAQVHVLPLSQLLGRCFAAVVIPGCDELRLPAAPPLPGNWSAKQRALLGLPSREDLRQSQLQAWRYALSQAQVDVLWRTSEQGERLMPAPYVQSLLLQGLPLVQPPAVPESPSEQTTQPPQPQAAALPVTRISASAYEDLRRCPYRFFALRQLQLQEVQELSAAVDKSDFGTWVHQVLQIFHTRLNPSMDAAQRLALMEHASQAATTKLGLSPSEFLPFAASWPLLRDAYLRWLQTHEAQGAVFHQAEVSKTMPLGDVELTGKLDRIDRLADGQTLVIDYKTENLNKTRQRLAQANEDTQLAFYAALLEDDTLRAAYLSLSEKEGARLQEQADIVALRDALVQGLQHDLARIHEGAALPALGEGAACDYCAARGLCRKDFWAV